MRVYLRRLWHEDGIDTYEPRYAGHVLPRDDDEPGAYDCVVEGEEGDWFALWRAGKCDIEPQRFPSLDAAIAAMELVR